MKEPKRKDYKQLSKYLKKAKHDTYMLMMDKVVCLSVKDWYSKKFQKKHIIKNKIESIYKFQSFVENKVFAIESSSALS